jgi:hypothetical protein
MAINPSDSGKQNEKSSVTRPPEPKEGAEKHKHKKDMDSDTRNSGFRSSRIRDAESRTPDTGDPSVS